MDVTPPTPAQEMFAGLVGRVLDLFSPVTEASPAAIASQFLVALGNAVGRGPHFYVGETRHSLNEYLLVVGRSARSRKGDGKNVALALLELADPNWAKLVASGLSSGEGLIHHVRDQVLGLDKTGNEIVVDKGVPDKRLLVIETEFSQPLKMFRREGNTLSNVMRDAWDGKPVLRTLTKKTPTKATDAHVAIVGHTTPEDLREYLADVETANGLGNRFLFAMVDREKCIADPRRAPRDAVHRLAAEVGAVLRCAGAAGQLTRTPDAAALWEQVYPPLTADGPGLVGKLLARAEAHVARLSALYALCAQRGEIAVEHLHSALAFWDYSVASAERIFADRTGNDTADRIKAEMLPGQALTLTDLRSQIFSNHISAGGLGDALRLLKTLKVIRLDERRTTGGRPSLVITRLEEERDGHAGHEAPRDDGPAEFRK